MPLYRKLWVKTTESLDLNDMPDDITRLLWVLIPLGLCREGRGIDNPAWIKAKIFPLREDVTQEQISESMDWYFKRKMIDRYKVNGRDYFQIRSWHRYQGNTTKEASSNFPPNQNQPEKKVSQELVKSNSRISKTPVSEKQSESASESSFNESSFNAFESNPVKILCDASGLSDFPADQREWVGVIQSLVDDHGVEKTTKAMKRACNAWVVAKTKNGRNYRKTNLNWINWAQEELAGGELPTQEKKKLTPEEQIKQLAAKMGGRSDL